MAIERVNDTRAFREFLDATLSNGAADLPLDDVLSLWEYENAPEEERAETLQAIRSGLDDMYAGRTRDAEEALLEMCRKHGLPEPR